MSARTLCAESKRSIMAAEIGRHAQTHIIQTHHSTLTQPSEKSTRVVKLSGLSSKEVERVDESPAPTVRMEMRRLSTEPLCNFATVSRISASRPAWIAKHAEHVSSVWAAAAIVAERTCSESLQIPAIKFLVNMDTSPAIRLWLDQCVQSVEHSGASCGVLSCHGPC